MFWPVHKEERVAMIFSLRMFVYFGRRMCGCLWGGWTWGLIVMVDFKVRNDTFSPCPSRFKKNPGFCQGSFWFNSQIQSVQSLWEHCPPLEHFRVRSKTDCLPVMMNWGGWGRDHTFLLLCFILHPSRIFPFPSLQIPPLTPICSHSPIRSYISV